MTKNVGMIDRLLRFLLGVLLVWLGLWPMNGLHGNVLGILVALVSLLPFYMVATRSCFVFKWLHIHSLSKAECRRYGDPLAKK
ncbi:MAG: DUF2892 domain-containing protein [Flavobacteriales bacterium]|nr:DUF2892 domain-containing protein [Flavobacteriales bacterium]MCB9447389.1 DUF2892 domain-containing protein [Flavobacteriales bacterium]